MPTVYADVGGFGASSQVTWQVLGTIDYRIKDWMVLRAGYRHLYIDYHAKLMRLNLAQSGALFGATFRF